MEDATIKCKNALKRLREKNDNLSMRELAEKIGFHHTTVSRWEKKGSISRSGVEAIKSSLGEDLSQFLNQRKEKKKTTQEKSSFSVPTSIDEASKQAEKLIDALGSVENNKKAIKHNKAKSLAELLQIGDWICKNSQNDEESAQGMYLQAHVWIERGREDWAIETLDKAIKLRKVSPTFRARLWANKALCHVTFGELEPCYGAIARAFELSREHQLEKETKERIVPWVHYLKARCRYEEGNTKSALEEIRTAILNTNEVRKQRNWYDWFSVWEAYYEMILDIPGARTIPNESQNVGWSKLEKILARNKHEDPTTFAYALLHMVKSGIDIPDFEKDARIHTRALIDAAQSINDTALLIEAILLDKTFIEKLPYETKPKTKKEYYYIYPELRNIEKMSERHPIVLSFQKIVKKTNPNKGKKK